MTTAATGPWEQRIAQARADLAALERQVEDGELAESDAARLRVTYLQEISAAEQAAEPLVESPPAEGGRSRRLLIGLLLAVVALVGVTFAASRALVPRPPSPSDADLSEVSNEAMEAVIADNPDDPQINGMRLALADRYFEEEAYQRAFEHYRIVLENDPAAGEAARALGRMGWMTYRSGEPELALESIERAIEVDPSYGEARYFLGLVQLCGMADHEAAATTLEEVLTLPDLPAEVRPEVEEALALARSGGTCG
jgi:tetratricopeptide (TPR) repeat protein